MTIILAALLAAAQPVTPPPGWELHEGRQFARDVCTEVYGLETTAACYAAYLRQQIINRAEDEAAQGYPPGDFRCTPAYRRWTNGEFIADDAPNCPSTCLPEEPAP